MQNKHSFLLSLVLSIILVSGCATTNSSQERERGQLEGLLLAEPEPIDSRTQGLIARYNYVLGQPTLANNERAQMHLQRGTLYDSIGLTSLARFDFTQALNIQPDLAPAYNSLGVHLTQNREFDQAFEAFDSTLDIDPNFEFALLNRGIALYYAGRPELGIKDFDSFLGNSPSDPFRLLWAYFAYYAVDPVNANAKLLAYREQLDPTHWAVSLVDLYLGKASENDVLNAVVQGVKSSQELTNRLCEAYFYLGKHQALQGNSGIALTYFKLSLSTNVYEYVEHKYVRLEIARIRESANARP